MSRSSTLIGVVVVVCCLIPLSGIAGSWYEGGTLHRATVSQWNKASYSNKLATAADMALSSSKVKAKVRASGSVDTLKPFAVELVACVNEAAAGQGYGHMSVAELAASCMVLMGW